MTQSANTEKQEPTESTRAFTAWLEKETAQLGWSFRELSRRAGLPDSTVEEALAHGASPTWTLCVHIGHALRMSPTAVLRKAGLLSAQSESWEERLAEVFETLAMLPAGAIRDNAVEAIRDVVEQAQRRAQGIEEE